MVNFWQKLPKPFLVLAPMDDVTDFVFREIMAELPRPDVFFTEFTSADGLLSKGYERVVRKLKYSQKQRPIVAQIWGTNPETLRKAAKMIAEMGFDGVDINMGCPERSVVKRGAGAGHIEDPQLAKEIISAVAEGAPDLPVSVKTRIGIGKVVTEEWVSFLLEQKIQALTVHGRTARQMSTGFANWEEVAKAVALRDKISPETVLIGNGDVKSFEQTVELSKKYGVDGVMIGRGVFSNPWVFEKSLSQQKRAKEDSMEILQKHLKLYVDTWQGIKDYQVMKKFFKMYLKDFDGASELRQKLMETKNHMQVEEILQTVDVKWPKDI